VLVEQDGTQPHVCAVALFDPPSDPRQEHGLEIGRLREYIASRLHLLPRYRQRLAFVPVQGLPIWIDDARFDIDYHVHHAALPRPGGQRELQALTARIASQPLDRDRPLWEFWFVEGLANGGFAVIVKIHHCMVDGVSGVDITTVLFDAEREPADPREEPERWLPEPEPSDAQVLSEALLERTLNPREVTRSIRRVMRGPRRALRKATEAVAAAGTFAWAGIAAPQSPFNFEVGPHRRFAWVRASLADLKHVKNELGGTVNDAILAAVAGALGRYMRARGHATMGLELRAMVPVSVRTDEQKGALGNRVTTMMAPLPVWCEDPARRLGLVSRAMGDLKQSNQALGASILTQLTDFAPPTVAGQAARLQARQRFFNLVVTNIPGPQFPLYLMGRRMERVFPMVPLAKNQGLCVGVMSYDGQVNFGLIGDYDGMPDLDDLARELEASIGELIEAAGGRPGIFRRFVPRSEAAAMRQNGDGGEREPAAG
jgi:WS/DGAT/MGAT family acyltransferase